MPVSYFLSLTDARDQILKAIELLLSSHHQNYTFTVLSEGLALDRISSVLLAHHPFKHL